MQYVPYDPEMNKNGLRQIRLSQSIEKEVMAQKSVIEENMELVEKLKERDTEENISNYKQELENLRQAIKGTTKKKVYLFKIND